ncbi:MAG: M23 family metallopeptidase [Thermoanaerobaculum sp.]|nr:M23 family metallopeptidase [Thermoanaerobaculum sp.]MDW7966596.1 M23 family metallopeptidase [Thermoanaerobaculum sp.]
MDVGAEPVWEVQWHGSSGGRVRRLYLTRRRLRLVRALAVLGLLVLLALVGALPVGVQGYLEKFTVRAARQENRRLRAAHGALLDQAHELALQLTTRINRGSRLAWMLGVDPMPFAPPVGQEASEQELLDWLVEESEKLLNLAGVLAAQANPPCSLPSLPTGLPLAAHDVVPIGMYGKRISPFTGQEEAHLGLTLAAPLGTKVLAAGQGRVAFAGTPRERTTNQWTRWGTLVALDHGGDVWSLYGHLGGVVVHPGQWVNRGQELGTVGKTGWTRVAALYFEVRWPYQGKNRPVDPLLVQLSFPLPQLTERLFDPTAGLEETGAPLEALLASSRSRGRR